MDSLSYNSLESNQRVQRIHRDAPLSSTPTPFQYFPALTSRMMHFLKDYMPAFKSLLFSQIFNGLGFALGSFIMGKLIIRWDGNAWRSVSGKLKRV